MTTASDTKTDATKTDATKTGDTKTGDTRASDTAKSDDGDATASAKADDGKATATATATAKPRTRARTAKDGNGDNGQDAPGPGDGDLSPLQLRADDVASARAYAKDGILGAPGSEVPGAGTPVERKPPGADHPAPRPQTQIDGERLAAEADSPAGG